VTEEARLDSMVFVIVVPQIVFFMEKGTTVDAIIWNLLNVRAKSVQVLAVFFREWDRFESLRKMVYNVMVQG